MATLTLSPTWRTRLARLALLVVAAATIATSDTDWQVYDEASLPLPSSIPPGGVVTRAVVMYQAPRGAWPLTVSRSLSFDSPATSRFGQAVFDDAEVKVVAGEPGQFEVRCTQKLCTGMIVMDVRLTHSLPQGGPVRGALGDGGLGGPSLRVSAGVYASPDRGFFGCQRQESSTDQENPPRQLMFDVTLEDFEADDDAPVDAGVATGSSALPALRGLDAGRE